MSNYSFHQTPRRTLIGGYRVGDVEVLLAQLRLLVTQLEEKANLATARLEHADADRRYVDDRLRDVQRREDAVATAQAQLRESQADAERVAEGIANDLIERAQSQASELLAQAKAEAQTARSEIEELVRLRNSLSSAVSEIVRHFERVTDVAPSRPQAPEASATEPPFTEPPRALSAVQATELFGREIEVDAGPFSDFASLSAFERALHALPKVEDVYIRRFEGERALIDLTLEEPAPLLDEMTERLPYTLDVNSAVSDRISVTVSAA